MVIFIVFGGLFVVNTPPYLSYMPKTSLIKWSYEALCVNEFQGLELNPKGTVGSLAVSKGETLLENIGFSKSTVNSCLKGLGSIIAFNYVFTYISLLRQKPSTKPLWKEKDVNKEERGKDKGNPRPKSIPNFNSILTNPDLTNPNPDWKRFRFHSYNG